MGPRAVHGWQGDRVRPGLDGGHAHAQERGHRRSHHLAQVLGPWDHGEHSPRPGPPGCSVVTSLAAVTASEATAAKFNICLF